MTSVRGRKPKTKVPTAVVAPPAGPKPPRIASVTISNNRESIIADALESVLSRVDVCVLVDTGISDNTIEIARQVAGDKLRVCKHAWKKNFAAARNASLDFAREYEADWAIVVDTDERFNWSDVDVRAACADEKSDVFYMHAADGSYIKEKIIRLDADVRYHGDVHEVPLAKSHAMLPKANFEELAKTPEQIREKYARDLPILMDMVSRPEMMHDGRWWYYLGDTHEGLGNNEQAARAFARCVELRTPVSEDGAWAAYRQAWMLIVLNRFQEAIEACARGLTRHAGVAELPWLAAVASARAGRNDQATYWAHLSIALGRFKGLNTPRVGFMYGPGLWENPYDVLRFSAPTPEERADAEREMQEAKRARLGARTVEDLDRLGITRSCRYKKDFREMLRPPCIHDLTDADVFKLEMSTKTLNEAGISGYHPMNPSLCVRKGKVSIVMRTVNYTIENGQYVTPEADGRIRTTNLLGEIVVGEKKMRDLRAMRDLDDGPRQPTRVLGYEDVRLFSVRGKLWGSATVRDRDNDRCQIALIEISPEGDIAKAHIQTESTQYIEKNWMPIVGDEIRWIYGLDPTTVRRRDGHMEALPTRFALDHLRGGSQVIPYEDGWLCVVHETIHQDGWGCRRIYLHRFVRFDKRFRVSSVSQAFTFERNYGIEFCSTLIRDPATKKLVLGYGVEDREAKLLVLTGERLKKLKWWTPEVCA